MKKIYLPALVLALAIGLLGAACGGANNGNTAMNHGGMNHNSMNSNSMNMNGMTHDMLMPGMLTEAEMAGLEKARGSEFDRLFLTYMIKHHQGAITMVDQLFASYGAAQDETVFRFASDVYADQTTEIDRMQQMLETVPPSRTP